MRSPPEQHAAALRSLAAEEFVLEPGLVYLSHAAVAPLPRRAVRAVADFCAAAAARPTLDYGRWLAAESRVRERLAALLGAPAPADVSLLKNTSEAISLVATGLPWRPGDSVVLPAGEFLSNRLPWLALAERGVEVREVPLGRGTDPAPLLAAIDASTRLVACSSVRYDSGARLELEPLGEACGERGILLCVDVIQSLGAVPFDVLAARCDFAVGGSHKWLLGPEGVGFLWASPEARDRLAQGQWGWRMLEDPFDFNAGLRPAAGDGRRFEAGTMNMMGLVALDASLSLFFGTGGMAAVAAAVRERSAWLQAAAAALPGVEVVTPRAPGAHAGITALAVPGGAARALELARALAGQGIQLTVRGGWLRLAPHFHTPPAQLEQAIAALAAHLG